MRQGQQISAEDIRGLSSDPRAAAPAFLTDDFTNKDIFGTMRGQCTAVRLHITKPMKLRGKLKVLISAHALRVQCKDCGGYWKATADYTVSAEDKETGVGTTSIPVFHNANENASLYMRKSNTQYSPILFHPQRRQHEHVALLPIAEQAAPASDYHVLLSGQCYKMQPSPGACMC